MIAKQRILKKSERQDMREDVKLMKGNEAIAHAAIRYGTDGYFGYPITPQSEIMETLMELMPLGIYWYGSITGRE